MILYNFCIFVGNDDDDEQRGTIWVMEHNFKYLFFSLSKNKKKQFFILEFVCLFVYIIFSFFFCLENEDNIMQSLKHVRVCIPIVLMSLIWMCRSLTLLFFFCCWKQFVINNLVFFSYLCTATATINPTVRIFYFLESITILKEKKNIYNFEE